MSDEAKAIEEAAKLGQRSLETLEKGGGWLDGVIGDGIRELGGVFADNMAAYRYRNRLNILKKTQAAIEAAGLQGHVRQLSDRVAVPLLEALSEESNDALQDVWAAYICNAANPSKPTPDRILIDVIRRLEPGDWPVIKVLFAAPGATLRVGDFGLSEADLSASLDRLTAVGLLDYEDNRSGYLVINHRKGMLSVSCSEATYYENRLLLALQRATEGAP